MNVIKFKSIISELRDELEETGSPIKRKAIRRKLRKAKKGLKFTRKALKKCHCKVATRDIYHAKKKVSKIKKLINIHHLKSKQNLKRIHKHLNRAQKRVNKKKALACKKYGIQCPTRLSHPALNL